MLLRRWKACANPPDLHRVAQGQNIVTERGGRKPSWSGTSSQKFHLDYKAGQVQTNLADPRSGLRGSWGEDSTTVECEQMHLWSIFFLCIAILYILYSIWIINTCTLICRTLVIRDMNVELSTYPGSPSESSPSMDWTCVDWRACCQWRLVFDVPCGFWVMRWDVEWSRHTITTTDEQTWDDVTYDLWELVKFLPQLLYNRGHQHYLHHRLVDTG